MTEFLEILKYTLPAIVVLLCAVWVMKSFMKAELNKKQLEATGKESEITIPLRLQAYERIVLLLERISPQQLALRIDPAGMDASLYQRVLLQTIRDEYEHNLAQQIYISTEAWRRVKSAKEFVVQMISQAANDLSDKAAAIDLASKLVELQMLEGNKQIDDTIGFVKKEVKGLF
jgi:hypothetical protein